MQTPNSNRKKRFIELAKHFLDVQDQIDQRREELRQIGAEMDCILELDQDQDIS